MRSDEKYDEVYSDAEQFASEHNVDMPIDEIHATKTSKWSREIAKKFLGFFVTSTVGYRSTERQKTDADNYQTRFKRQVNFILLMLRV